MMRIDIITPSYNNLSGLIQLVDSLEQLTWPKEKIRLLICNDGSTDETETFFKKKQAGFKISVLSREKRAGPAAARNMGLEKAEADIILFLDSDVVVEPDLIDQHVEKYLNPKILAVRGEYYSMKNTKKDKWTCYLDSHLRGPRLEFSRNKTTTLSFNKVNTNNFSIRATALESGLRFDENITHYGGEDMVFAYQLLKLDKGIIVYQPNARTFHKQNKMKRALEKLEEYGRYTIPYLLKTYPELYPDLIISRFYKKNTTLHEKFSNRILFHSSVYFFIGWIRKLSPARLSFKATQYLMAWHVIKGYRQSRTG